MQHLPDITSQLSYSELFNAFKVQLAKDCQQSNFPNEFVSKLVPDYASIHRELSNALQRYENKTDFHLQHLLYRVDISEAQLKKYLNSQPDESYFDVIAELIIKRELQKVVIKQFYKSAE